MTDSQRTDTIQAIAEYLNLPDEQVELIKSQPSTFKRNEMITQLAVDAIKKSGPQSDALRRAKARIIELTNELQNGTQPPYTIGVCVNLVEDKGFVDVARSGQVMRLALSAVVTDDDLGIGKQLLVDDKLSVVKVLDFEGHGQIMTIKEVFPDETRALVVGRNDDEQVVYLSDAVRGLSLQQGHSLLVNTRANIAVEAITKTEVNNLTLEEVPDISYADIGGLNDQIKKIRDAVELPYLHPEMYEKYSLKSPKGILLYGPPGCGKTMIAKAIASALAKKVADTTDQDVKAYFLNIKGPELLNKYVGETERYIRELFQRAREKASAGNPVVIFFDEMESLFSTRGSGISSDTEKTIVPQLLTELDGVESLSNVIVIGASNREDLIDPAVTRPGRLDIKIRIERPDSDAAVDIFSKYLNIDLPLHKTVLDQFDGNRATCLQWMVQQTVDYMYETSDRTQFLTVIYENGDDETLHFKDFNSGAMIQNIVDRAKKSAILDELDTGNAGISLQHLYSACDDEFQDNEDLPNTTNPHDWARITGRKGQRIVKIRPIMRTDTQRTDYKPVETVESRNTGLYL